MSSLKNVLADMLKKQCTFILKYRGYHKAALSSKVNREFSFNLQNAGKRIPLTFDEINPQIYRDRRLNLMNLIGQKCCNNKKIKGHFVVIPSGTKTYMSENIPYPFRQNTDFLYLTGVKEPDSILLLHTATEKTLPEHSSILFIPKTNENIERWEGKKMTIESAINDIGIDKAYLIDDFERYFHSNLKESGSMIWCNYSRSAHSKLQGTIHNLMSDCNITSIDSPHSLVQQLRLVKSDLEIQLMKQSCEIASEALTEVMTFSYPSVLESHLHAKMEFECRIRGADTLAFPPVVAGGDRANTIHYITNNQVVKENETVLVDVGCEYHGYSSDITRTWPVSGKFTSPQRNLYEAIFAVQEELLELCKSFPSLDHLFQVMCTSMGQKFQKIGLISQNVSKEEASRIAYNFCPHHVSHYLGMDVHDTGLISRGINIQPGMIITIEPGVYIQKNDESVPPEYRGLCVRIEDDILITNDGPILLTATCPRHIQDIEKLLSTRT